MPMVDFYNTLPRAEESPMEYWIWLNKAIDVADECVGVTSLLRTLQLKLL